MPGFEPNLEHAEITRQEIIDEVCCGEPRLQRDWFDIPMKRISARRFQIHLPLCEVGHFETKCYFLRENDTTPIWPEGENVVVNVEPADTCCANIIYNAFVRQFGPNIAGNAGPAPAMADGIKALDKAGYTVIPPSGTFRDLIGKLDFIISELGCSYHSTAAGPPDTHYLRTHGPVRQSLRGAWFSIC